MKTRMTFMVLCFCFLMAHAALATSRRSQALVTYSLGQLKRHVLELDAQNQLLEKRRQNLIAENERYLQELQSHPGQAFGSSHQTWDLNQDLLAQMETLYFQLNTKTKSLLDIKSQVAETEAEIKNLMVDLKQPKPNQDLINTDDPDVMAIQVDLKKSQRRIEQFDKEIKAIQSKHRRHIHRIQKIMDEFDIVEHQRQTLVLTVQDLTQQVDTIVHSIEKLEADHKNQLKSIHNNMLSLKEKSDQLQRVLLRAQDKLARKKGVSEQDTTHLDMLVDNLRVMRLENSKLKNRFQSLKDSVAKLKSKTP